ncbi:MAG: N-acetylmuramoyl-L-alanine amidase [Lachnospiraceae bacterium]|nr:N-acetylmuramoyl-L-alanine amidase [Lachnospiraceae bacterium]
MLHKIKKGFAFLMTVAIVGQIPFMTIAFAEQSTEAIAEQNPDQTEQTPNGAVESEESQKTEGEESTEKNDADKGDSSEQEPESTEKEPGDTEEEPVREVVVVLDPGHGGADGGACRDGYVERDLALSIAYYCKEELEKHPGFTVYMTRTDNSSDCMGRDDRVEYAWEKDADLLVSLHLNATGSYTTTQSGAEVYYPNGNYNAAMSSLGYRAAESILTELCGLGLPNNGCKTRMSNDTYYFDGTVADYLGINYWSKLKGIPGVLVEHAYINNPGDRAYYLSSEEQLKALGVADAIGIVNYFKQNEDAVITLGGSWEYDDNGWWYKRPDGSYPYHCWEMIDGRWFYFDERGYQCRGWKRLGERWYYLGTHGTMMIGWHKIDGVWYYFSPDSGDMVEGWLDYNGQWYFLYPEDGNLATGWLYTGSHWYYLRPESGAMITGWCNIAGTWYYFDSDGRMLTGWYEADGKWYYSYTSGAMASNTRIGQSWVGADGAWIP